MTNELWYPASPSLPLFLLVSPRFTSRSIDYWNTLRSLPLFTCPCWSPLHPPLFHLRRARSPRALLYLVPFIWLIWYLELICLWIRTRVFTYICLHLPISHFPHVHSPLSSSAFLLFFCGILIMKSGCSPSSVLAAFVVLKVTNRLLICTLWFLKLTDICIILLPAFPSSKVACRRFFHWMELRAVNIMACLIRFWIFVERSVRELQKYAASKMSPISKKPDWSRAQKVKCFIFPLWQVGLIRFL